MTGAKSISDSHLRQDGDIEILAEDALLMTSNKFAKPLVEFWAKLEDTIHPLDRQVLANRPNSLNLRYPPPAFVGDISSAKIFVLMANGGFDEFRTAKEFSASGSAALYRERLRHPQPCDESNTAAYYLKGKLGSWLRQGKAAIVNALAYRSPKISKEPDNVAIAEELPSVKFHRDWCRKHLLPELDSGRILVVAKRPKLWRISASDSDSDLLLFPKNHLSPHLPASVVERAKPFLR